MKKILITGANSYIGSYFSIFMRKFSGYQVDSVSIQDGAWKKKDFTGYDVIFHTAGIAHRKETEKNAYLYYEVNRDLTLNVAKKAKEANVKQFVFLSSMSVYGMDSGVIDKDTKPNPKNNYGKSKLQAEEKLAALDDDRFQVCVLRPPMVYGRDCKGNFQSIVKIVKKYHIFPRVKNRRSMIYIDNLSHFVKMAVDKELGGLYFPQNKEYVRTDKMASLIAGKLNRKIYYSRIIGSGVVLLRPFVTVARKAFGSLIYKNTEDFNFSYCVVGFDESIKESV